MGKRIRQSIIKLFGILKKAFKKIAFRIKLRAIDDHWRSSGCNSCFALFPPSFYLTHTPEEIEQISKEEIAKLRKMLAEYEEKYGVDTKPPE